MVCVRLPTRKDRISSSASGNDQRLETFQNGSRNTDWGIPMCFMPAGGKRGSRVYVHKKFLHTKAVTKANKQAIAKALGMKPGKLKTGKKLHLVHED